MVEFGSRLWTEFESGPFSSVDAIGSTQGACLATLREVIRRLPDVINPCVIGVLVASEGFESRPIRSTNRQAVNATHG